MGTRGYFAFRYRGKYYVVYNNLDSYFDWLGCELIQAIKELTTEQWEEIKQKLASHSVINDDRDSEDEYEDYVPNMEKDANILLTVMKSYRGSFVTYEEPKLDVFIEYVYILDLDVDVFTAISRHHKDEDADYGERRYSCRFENLSKDWLLNLDSE